MLYSRTLLQDLYHIRKSCFHVLERVFLNLTLNTESTLNRQLLFVCGCGVVMAKYVYEPNLDTGTER